MISVTPEDVVSVAPEFADLAGEEDGQDQMKQIIEFARTMVSEGHWGGKAKFGICLMAAHLLKDLGFGGDATGAAGPVTSEKVGDLQRSYGQIQGGTMQDQMLATTKYGKNFLMLRRTIPTTPLVI